MKRCWFGGGLLILLLISGLFVSRKMDYFHRELSGIMVRAAALTGENREEAQHMANRAKAAWENRRWLTAALNDHAPMEEIEENFCLLQPDTEEADFRKTCLRLAAQLAALGESQRLTLENLF